MKLEHPPLDARHRPGLIAARGEATLHARAQPAVLVVDLRVDTITQVTQRLHFMPIIAQAKQSAADHALAGSARQYLEEVQLLGKHIDPEVWQGAVEAPAAPLILG